MQSSEFYFLMFFVGCKQLVLIYWLLCLYIQLEKIFPRSHSFSFVFFIALSLRRACLANHVLNSDTEIFILWVDDMALLVQLV
jgi:hypothetical protein